MADIFSKQKRSLVMSAVPLKNTKPEIALRRYLHAKGLRFRNNDKRLPGSPDIVLKKYSTVIFVNGCFWHGHSHCRYARLPSTNTEFWSKKIASNKKRDSKKIRELKKAGWKVLVVWQCDLKKEKEFERIFNRVVT
jgi:DNA mismatch endonuclease, patch repair protein